MINSPPKSFANAVLRSVISCLLVLPAGALAYYDDVHFALTYYISRQTGYTPEQSKRIASACSRVDYDERTEPVQLFNQLMALIQPLPENIHYPRSKFHAFRDESDESKRVIGNEPDGQAAQDGVLKLLRELGEFSVSTAKNPGVFLHAYQDWIPHYGYGTFWGHNPAQQSQFDRHARQGIIMGSTTDWIGHRPADVLRLCQSTHGELLPSLNRISPHQYVRGYYAAEYENLVAKLANANPAPEPLESNLDRLCFIYFALSDKGAPAESIMRAVHGQANVDKILESLKDPAQRKKMESHLKGPDLKKAYAVVNEALASAGMTDRLPEHHYPYKLSSQGGPSDPAQLDDWVLVGEATLETTGYQAASVTLHMDYRDAAGKTQRVQLFGIAPVTIAAGRSHTWVNLPIGDLFAVLACADGSTKTVPLAMRMRKNKFMADVGGTAPPDPVRLPDPEKQAPPLKPVPAGIADFNGTWFSSVGRYGYPHDPFVMTQSDTEVNGNFKHASGSGTIKGTVKEWTLTFTYTYTSGDFSETGTGTFVMKRDNKSFSGSYSSDLKDGIKNNGWRGHKK
jgi:hypothetical protein